MDSQGLWLQHFCVCGAPINRVLYLRIHFSLCIQSILPGNVSHICREDSGVTSFREYPSWCFIWNSTAMNVIATEEGSVISQSESLAADCTGGRDTKVNPQYTNLYFTSKKKSTHVGLLQIRRMSVDYRHLVCVHWNWNKLEFWHLSFIFLRLLCVSGDELCQLVPVCHQDHLTAFLTQNCLKILNLLRNFWLKTQYHGSRIFHFSMQSLNSCFHIDSQKIFGISVILS